MICRNLRGKVPGVDTLMFCLEVERGGPELLAGNPVSQAMKFSHLKQNSPKEINELMGTKF